MPEGVVLIIQVLMGDLTWKDNLDFGVRLIYKHGGPAAVLAAQPGNFARRFFLELLATTEVFSGFSLGFRTDRRHLHHGAGTHAARSVGAVVV